MNYKNEITQANKIKNKKSMCAGVQEFTKYFLKKIYIKICI